jgi:hypothetical protein
MQVAAEPDAMAGFRIKFKMAILTDGHNSSFLVENKKPRQHCPWSSLLPKNYTTL